MPDKPTDKEIVKALEDWIKNYDGSYVNFKTLGNALDLINRLQADLKIAENINHLQMEELQSKKAELDEYAKIKTTIDEFWEILLTLSLFKRKEKPTLEEFAEAIQEIKAEAYKEFANWQEIKLALKGT